MKHNIYKRHKLPLGFAIVGMYMAIILTAIILFKVNDLQSGGTVYAMVNMNASASEMYIYVRTLGQNTINGIDKVIQDEVIDESQISHEMIMSEQNNEGILEASIEVHAPQKYVNGLKIVNRGETELNKKELGMIYRIVEAEAGGEDVAGRMLVANVILNRMKCNRFSDTVKGVIFAHDGSSYQFSPISDGRYYSVNVSNDTKKAVKRAVGGEDNSNGAEYFMCRSLSDSGNIRWFDTRLKYLFKHGCHEFYKK